MRVNQLSQEHDTSKFSNARADTLTADLDILLGNLCLHWGFCNDLTGEQLVARGHDLTADQFAQLVLVAEGFPNPELELEWHRQFKRLFIERYGEVVSATSYRGTN